MRDSGANIVCSQPHRLQETISTMPIINVAPVTKVRLESMPLIDPEANVATPDCALALTTDAEATMLPKATDPCTRILIGGRK